METYYFHYRKGFLLFLLLMGCLMQQVHNYQIGIGRADCTGPSTEIIFMGYAKVTQIGCGIHLRQFSRAYIVDDGRNRVVFVSVDTAMMAHGLRKEVLKRLHELYGSLYNEGNVLISGTHTHGTPGGFLMDFMLDLLNLGFIQETFNALAEGITQSIVNAHSNMVEGKIYLKSGNLLEANINRSPASYLANPEDERAKYDYNVDKEMVQLKFVRTDGVPIGAINWFAVHPTSMNNSNCLVSSDNVGYASILLEDYVSGGALPGTGDFVGGFASTNLGDVSPNTKGAICIDTGEECDFVTSTCNGSAQPCIAFGPGDNMQESTRIIAGKLFEKAKELFLDDANALELSGPVRSIHQFVNMPEEVVTVTLPNGTVQNVKGCRPAMGYSFAGGTTDGPGAFNFHQGTLEDDPFWNGIRDLVFPPSEETIACHHPKPILINSGEISFPYAWQPEIVSTQILQIGQAVLIGVPGEFTTMSGRRLRDAVKGVIVDNGGSLDTKPIIAGLSNVYTNYIATPEEYGVQRYEGGSTVYGPWTLDIYLNKYRFLASILMTDEAVEPGPSPPDFPDDMFTLVTPPQVDGLSPDQNFGDCVLEPPETAARGDSVLAKFISGSPRHNLLHEDTYLKVEKALAGDWQVIATDASWDTKFLWERTNFTTGENVVTIEWSIGENVDLGTYRIRHNGHYKVESGEIYPYEGVTREFNVV